MSKNQKRKGEIKLVSKPDNHNFRKENSVKLTQKKKHSFFADIKLQFHQFKKKMAAKLNNPFFI